MVTKGNIERASTGIAELDGALEGGFPKNGLIIISGYPGAGKSTLAAQFIYEGATKHDEKGVYACFAESKRSLINIWKRFGWDFEKLESENKVAILDMISVKEAAIQSSINQILEEVNTLQAKRLVIDSFTALSLALRNQSDIRFLLHLIYKFIQEIKCTALIIVDSQWGSHKIGTGIEEFIADGIILMQQSYNPEEKLVRKLRILKMRGTSHSRDTLHYDISKKGIQIEAIK
jgi:circadian clock protein KaiC